MTLPFILKKTRRKIHPLATQLEWCRYYWRERRYMLHAFGRSHHK